MDIINDLPNYTVNNPIGWVYQCLKISDFNIVCVNFNYNSTYLTTRGFTKPGDTLDLSGTYRMRSYDQDNFIVGENIIANRIYFRFYLRPTLLVQNAIGFPFTFIFRNEKPYFSMEYANHYYEYELKKIPDIFQGTI